MKLEQNEVPFLFSSTTLSDVFFTEYLCETPGDYIKVYLYLVFLSKYNKEIKINDFSKKLSLPIKLIEEAFSFLENLNLITKKGNDFIVNNLQEIELHKLYTPNIGLSKEKIEDNAKKQSVAKMIEAINSTFFQGIMSPSWYNDIDLWVKKYKFDEEVMLALFRYCFEKSALHRNYVATVAEAWYANNIRTFDDLDEYFEKQEKLTKIKKEICKKLGLNRKLTQYEEAYVEKWISEYNYPFEVIELALKKTTSKTNPNFDYLDKMISDWYDKNLSRADDVKKYLLEFKNKTKKVQELQKKTNYNNYDQREITNFDDLYANN